MVGKETASNELTLPCNDRFTFSFIFFWGGGILFSVIKKSLVETVRTVIRHYDLYD